MVDPIAAEDDSSAGVKENWTRTKHRWEVRKPQYVGEEQVELDFSTQQCSKPCAMHGRNAQDVTFEAMGANLFLVQFNVWVTGSLE
jgi:hypothetical protein